MDLAEKLLREAGESPDSLRNDGRREDAEMIAARVVEKATPHSHRLSSGPGGRPSEALLSSALLSTRPRKLLTEISKKTDDLLTELKVILIQRIARGYICRRVLKIDQLVGAIKSQLGISFAETILEEMVLTNAMAIAANELKKTLSEKEVSDSLNKESQIVYEGILRERLPVELRYVVEFAVQENVQDFIQERKKQQKVSNPLLRLIYDLMEEALHENMVDLVTEVVNERVDDHLMTMRCRVAFHTILFELIEQVISENFEELYADVEIEIAGLSIVAETTDEMIQDFVGVIVDEIKENLLEAQLSKERIAVEHHLKNGLITRLLLLYLMNSISDKFSTVQMEYFSKALDRKSVV